MDYLQVSREIERCDREIARAKAMLRSGHTDVAGLMLALHDWYLERRLLPRADELPQDVEGVSEAGDCAVNGQLAFDRHA